MHKVELRNSQFGSNFMRPWCIDRREGGFPSLMRCPLRDQVAADGFRASASQHSIEEGATQFDTMLLLQPMTSAVDLQPRAIDEDMNRSILAGITMIIAPPFQQSRLACPPAQGCVIGNGEIQPHQVQHPHHKTLRLTKTRAEHPSQRQGDLDRQIGIARLATGRCPLRRLPGRQSPGVIQRVRLPSR
ncbi:hypothetical protein GGD45_006400 [Rhizobium tropici]|uniref:Uncharacterized protein n=1 Tax=Rhizobium tropici TaxID=398 RepID=A0ABR6R9R1_RHITR|nr:hypothetical protein [Rhizobium tropici]